MLLMLEEFDAAVSYKGIINIINLETILIP